MLFDSLRQHDDRKFQIDDLPEKGQEYQAVRILEKDSISGLRFQSSVWYARDVDLKEPNGKFYS